MTVRTFANHDDAQRQAGFNPHVHGARGLFALMVFVFHISHSGSPTFAWASGHYIRTALSPLQYGVELFFGISVAVRTSGGSMIGVMERTIRKRSSMHYRQEGRR